MNGFGISKEPMFTLNTVDRHAVCAAFSAGQGEKAGGIGWQEECAPSLKAAASGTNTVPTVYDARGNGDGKTICTITGDHENRVTDYTALVMAHGQANAEICKDLSPTLNCNHEQPIFVPSVGHALKAKANCQFREDSETYIAGQTVRRLTPLECERLQGYPDGWTDIGDWTDSKGKRHKEADSPRYKALGNSIALPFWCWLAKRISAQYERDITMGSLFDGIGGFPYAFEKCNGKGAAQWASEIEEFPIAVTKIRFGEE